MLYTHITANNYNYHGTKCSIKCGSQNRWKVAECCGIAERSGMHCSAVPPFPGNYEKLWKTYGNAPFRLFQDQNNKLTWSYCFPSLPEHNWQDDCIAFVILPCSDSKILWVVHSSCMIRQLWLENCFSHCEDRYSAQQPRLNCVQSKTKDAHTYNPYLENHKLKVPSQTDNVTISDVSSASRKIQWFKAGN